MERGRPVIKNSLGSPYTLEYAHISGDRVRDQFVSCVNGLISKRSADLPKPEMSKDGKKPRRYNQVRRLLPEFVLGVNAITRSLEKYIGQLKVSSDTSPPFSVIVTAHSQDERKLTQHLPSLCYLTRTSIVRIDGQYFAKMFDASSVLAFGIKADCKESEVNRLIKSLLESSGLKTLNIPWLEPIRNKLSKAGEPVEISAESRVEVPMSTTTTTTTKKRKAEEPPKDAVKVQLKPLKMEKSVQKRPPSEKKKVDAWNTKKSQK